jgi:hypothetical protein
MRKKKIRVPKIRAAALLAAAMPVLTGLVLMGALGGVVLGLPRLQSLVAASSPPSPVRVEFAWPVAPGAGSSSTWMPEEFQRGLTGLVGRALADDPDPLSSNALRAAADALAATGWFESVDVVERGSDGVVRVRGRWRVPAAVVRYGGLDQLVAWSGQVLPPTYLPGESGQKVVFGVRTPPPEAGRAWAEEAGEVRAALELLALISDRSWRNQVAGVDASDYPTKRRLEIVTVYGTRITWGGAPNDAVPGEQAAHYKLRRLDVLADRFGRIDAKERFVDVAGPLTLIDKRPAGSP